MNFKQYLSEAFVGTLEGDLGTIKSDILKSWETISDKVKEKYRKTINKISENLNRELQNDENRLKAEISNLERQLENTQDPNRKEQIKNQIKQRRENAAKIMQAKRVKASSASNKIKEQAVREYQRGKKGSGKVKEETTREETRTEKKLSGKEETEKTSAQDDENLSPQQIYSNRIKDLENKIREHSGRLSKLEGNDRLKTQQAINSWREQLIKIKKEGPKKDYSSKQEEKEIEKSESGDLNIPYPEDKNDHAAVIKYHNAHILNLQKQLKDPNIKPKRRKELEEAIKEHSIALQIASQKKYKGKENADIKAHNERLNKERGYNVNRYDQPEEKKTEQSIPREKDVYQKTNERLREMLQRERPKMDAEIAKEKEAIRKRRGEDVEVKSKVSTKAPPKRPEGVPASIGEMNDFHMKQMMKHYEKALHQAIQTGADKRKINDIKDAVIVMKRAQERYKRNKNLGDKPLAGKTISKEKKQDINIKKEEVAKQKQLKNRKPLEGKKISTEKKKAFKSRKEMQAEAMADRIELLLLETEFNRVESLINS